MNYSQDKDRPRKFFNSISDSGYYLEEQYYVGSHLLALAARKRKLPRGSDEDEVKQLHDWLCRLRACWQDGYGGKPDFSKISESEVVRIITQAIKRFGFDAVRMPWFLEVQRLAASAAGKRCHSMPCPNCS